MLGRITQNSIPNIKQSTLDEIINKAIKDNNVSKNDEEIVKSTIDIVIKELQNSKKIKITN